MVWCVLRAIGSYVERRGETRNGLLARAAPNRMRREAEPFPDPPPAPDGGHRRPNGMKTRGQTRRIAATTRPMMLILSILRSQAS